jgi:hypothetical protein
LFSKLACSLFPDSKRNNAAKPDCTLPIGDDGSLNEGHSSGELIGTKINTESEYNSNLQISKTGIAERAIHDLFHDAHLKLRERMKNPIAFHAEMMGEIMYYHQALKQPDASQFVDAIIKEINGHVDN